MGAFHLLYDNLAAKRICTFESTLGIAITPEIWNVITTLVDQTPLTEYLKLRNMLNYVALL